VNRIRKGCSKELLVEYFQDCFRLANVRADIFRRTRHRVGVPREGVLERYWGEHIHLGYYTDEERRKGYKKKDFKQAKRDFVREMLKFSGAKNPKTILDVGCGFGGTSRMLARLFPHAEVEGEQPP
jgi:2-polyprenyl-3-methyl-5-hydroxy-6-metoxy-1,4-benzoquinol methylase